MPIYTVHHNGQVYELQAPEGTTAEQLQAAVEGAAGQGQATPQAAPQNTLQQGSEGFQRASGYGPVAAGVADAAIKGALGIKQIFGGLSDEQKGVLKALEDEEQYDPNGFQRGVGNVVGNVAMTMLPGIGWGAKGKAVLPMLAKTIAARSSPKVGALAAAMGTSGAAGLALNPGQGGTYTEQIGDKIRQSAEDAMAGGVLQQGGRLLSKTVRGVKMKMEARKLMEQGVQPTLQQGAENPITRFIGGLTSGMTNVKGRQEKEVLDALTKRIAGGNASLQGGTLAERVGLMDDVLGDEYIKVLGGKRFPISPAVRKEVADQGSRVMTNTGQFAKEAGQASSVISNVMGDAKNNMNVNSETLIRNYLLPLAREASQEDNPMVKKALLNARQVLVEKSRNVRLTQDELDLVRAVDSRYYDLSRLRDVAKGAAGEGEGVPVQRLVSAYANAPKSAAGNTTMDDLLGPAQRSLGTTPTQDASRTGWATAKRILPLAGAAGAAGATGTGVGAAALMAAPVYGLSALGQTRAGAKVLFGGTKQQKEMADFLRKIAPHLAASGQTLTPEMGEN